MNFPILISRRTFWRMEGDDEIAQRRKNSDVRRRTNDASDDGHHGNDDVSGRKTQGVFAEDLLNACNGQSRSEKATQPTLLQDTPESSR